MSYYISRLYDFLRELQANNNREWFAAHKEEYDSLRSLWLDDVDRLIGLMSQWEPQLRALKAKDCVYRIYRDTRFSTDKTPYKVYFSAAFSPWGRKTHRAAYYIICRWMCVTPRADCMEACGAPMPPSAQVA